MLLDWLPGRTEKRATFKDTDGWFVDWLRGGAPTASGEAVGPKTAMGLAVYYAGIRNIAEDVAKMPLPVIRRSGGGKRQMLKKHPAYVAMNEQPNPEMSPMAWRETTIHHAMGWGNGISEIVSNRGGTEMELWPIDPTAVSIKRNEMGRLVYEVTISGGGTVKLPPEKVFHLHGLGFDGVTGYSVARLARESIGLGLAEVKAGAGLFGNSSMPGGTLNFPNILQPDAKDAIRKSWEENHMGAGQASKTALLDRGVTFTPISVNPRDAQWISSREFTVEEICRWLRIPPSKVQHLKKANFNTLEMQNLEYVTDTLLSWMIRFEQEVKRKLIGFKDPNVYAKHNANGILRGDIKTRYSSFAIGRQWGWESPNSVLELEDRDGIGEQGDIYLVPGNMMDASKINEPEPKPEAPNPTDGTTDGDGDDDDQLDAGTRAAIADRAHEGVAQAVSAKDAISKIVWAHAPAIEDQLTRTAAFVDENRAKTKKPPDVFRSERIDHTSRCLNGVVGACLKTAWVMLSDPVEPSAPYTLEPAAAEFANGVATRHIDTVLSGEVNIPATVTAESGRLCKLLEGMICVEA